MAEIYFNKTLTAPFLKKALNEIHYTDKQSEKYKSISGSAGIACLVLFFLSICTAAFTGPFALCGIGGTAVLGIICWIIWAHFNKFDVEDRRLAVAREFIDKLEPDIEDKKPVHLYVDFRPYQKYAKVLSPDKSRYLELWFMTRGNLSDGNKFKIFVANKISRKEKQKNKGKKLTEKIREKITYLIKIDPQAYPNYQQVINYLPKGKRILNMVLTSARLSGTKLKLEFAPISVYKRASYSMTSESGKEYLSNEVKLIKGLLVAYSALKKCR